MGLWSRAAPRELNSLELCTHALQAQGKLRSRDTSVVAGILVGMHRGSQDLGDVCEIHMGGQQLPAPSPVGIWKPERHDIMVLSRCTEPFKFRNFPPCFLEDFTEKPQGSL